MIKRILLRRRKEKALFEVRCDLEFIRKYRGDSLRFVEDVARGRMSELKRKEGRSAEEDAELVSLIEKISNSTATKAEYEKLQQLESELGQYIAMLK